MEAIAERAMGRPKGRPKRSDQRDEGTAKLDRALIGKAKLIAAHRGIAVGEVLSELVRGPLDKAYAQMLRELEGGK